MFDCYLLMESQGKKPHRIEDEREERSDGLSFLDKDSKVLIKEECDKDLLTNKKELKK